MIRRWIMLNIDIDPNIGLLFMTSGLTVPLLLASDGSKVGKTTSTNQDDVIWMNPSYVRPFHFYQRILNLPDKLMTPEFIKCLSFFSLEEIDHLLNDQKVCSSRFTFTFYAIFTVYSCSFGSRAILLDALRNGL